LLAGEKVKRNNRERRRRKRKRKRRGEEKEEEEEASHLELVARSLHSVCVVTVELLRIQGELHNNITLKSNSIMVFENE